MTQIAGPLPLPTPRIVEMVLAGEVRNQSATAHWADAPYKRPRQATARIGVYSNRVRKSDRSKPVKFEGSPLLSRHSNSRVKDHPSQSNSNSHVARGRAPRQSLPQGVGCRATRSRCPPFEVRTGQAFAVRTGAFLVFERQAALALTHPNVGRSNWRGSVNSLRGNTPARR